MTKTAQQVKFAALVALAGMAPMSGNVLALSFTTVETGVFSSCGVTPGRQLWCWGINAQGVLGTDQAVGDVAQTPVRVDLEDVTAVSVGHNHACAIAGGQAWCWGAGTYGKLGIGPVGHQTYRRVPVRVGGELAERSDATAISAGDSGACAIAGGQVYCWGRGHLGQIGDGLTHDEAVLSPRPAWINGASQVGVGESHVCAIAQGSVWCWGNGLSGGLGNGSTGGSAVPVTVTGLPENVPVEHLTVGLSHTCAIAAGKAWCWGYNSQGQLGTGDTVARTIATPVTWGQPAAVAHIDAGYAHTCAIDSTGRSWCWGNDMWGQLGNDFALQGFWMPVPVYAPFGAGSTALSAGGKHTCGVAEGTAYCWGSNELDQLGVIADIEYAQVPIPVNVDRLFDSGFDS